MLNKNKIDKKLRKYINEHLSKSYSRHAVKKVLVEHGYNEFYIDILLKKHAELQFIKKYAIITLFLFLILNFSLNLFSRQNQITGFAINSELYYALDVSHIQGSVTFNSINLKKIDMNIENTEASGFLIKVFSSSDEEISEFYYDMPDNKNYLIYIPYNENIAKIELYNPSKSKLMEVDVNTSLEIESENPTNNYWIWAVLMISILITVIFFIRQMKENRVVSLLRQYINENLNKGFTLDKIKEMLYKEGYTRKEVEKALR